MMRFGTAALVVLGTVWGTWSTHAAEKEGYDRPLIFSVNPVGNGDFIGAPHRGSDFVRYDELVFQRCSEIGSRSARVLASWREVEAVKGQWDWSGLDREIRLCEKYDIEPVVLICNIPAWVSPTGKTAHDHPPKEEYAADFTNFITEMAQRYKGRARHYEFWNEQNGCSWINEGCKNAQMAHTYLPWLRRCYRAIKAVDPDAQVAIGGLDDVDGHAPLFVEQCYKLRKEEYDNEKFWDAIAEHPYNKRAEDTAEIAIAKLDAIRAVAAKYGDQGIPLWITEYGWNTNEMEQTAQTQGTIGFLMAFMEEDQKDLLIAQQLAMVDFEPVHRGWGLCDLNLRPQPAFSQFQFLARPDAPQTKSLRWRPDKDGTLLLTGSLVRRSSPGAKTSAQVQMVNEQGQVLATKPIDRTNFSIKVDDLPRDTPLLAVFSHELGGKRQAPFARLPVIVPTGVVPNGGFESPFRAGIAWGWSPVGESICRDGATVSPKHRHGGQHSQMLILFDNSKLGRFDDLLQIPVAAAKGQRFQASCQAKYLRHGGKEKVRQPFILVSIELIDPARQQDPTSGTLIADKGWTEVSAELTAPCDAPTLVVRPRSSQLESKGAWLLCIDDVSLEPTP